MMQANLTEKAITLIRIGEANGFQTDYYEYSHTLVFSCGNVTVELKEEDPDLQTKYDDALGQLVAIISHAKEKAIRVLDVLNI